MDTADAVFAHATPERRLAIMRDPCVGAFGVAAFVAVLLLKVTAIDGLAPSVRLGALILAPVLGRVAIVQLAVLFPYGRADGLATPLRGAASGRTLALALMVPLVVALASGPAAIAALALAIAGAWLFGRWLMTKLPGLTGDCYGAGCELIELLALLAAGPLSAARG